MQQDQAQIRYFPNFDNLELLRANYVRHTFDAHMHEGFAIGVVEKGSLQFNCRGKDYTVQAGDIFAINPQETHSGTAFDRGGWQYRMLYPSLQMVQQISAELTERTVETPYFVQPVIRDPQLASQIQRSHRLLEESPQTIEQEVALRRIISQLILRHAINKPASPSARVDALMMERVRLYIDLHYAENLTLEHLADVAGFSPFHFLRVFQTYFGISPHKYMTHLRIKHAKTLLLTGQAIKDVAANMGFTDQSHFTKRFKGVVGVTPGQYQQAL